MRIHFFRKRISQSQRVIIYILNISKTPKTSIIIYYSVLGFQFPSNPNICEVIFDSLSWRVDK